MARSLESLDFALLEGMVDAHTLLHLGIAIPITEWYK